MLLKTNLKYNIEEMIQTVDALMYELSQCKEVLQHKNDAGEYLNLSDVASKVKALEYIQALVPDHISSRAKWYKEQLIEQKYGIKKS